MTAEAGPGLGLTAEVPGLTAEVPGLTAEVPGLTAEVRLVEAAPVDNGLAVTGPRVAVRAGDRVRFGVDPGRQYFFDPDTYLAIGRPTG